MSHSTVKQISFTAALAPSVGFGMSALFGFNGTWRLAGWQPSFTGFYYRWHSSSLPS